MKIGICIQFRGEFDRQLIPQWIEYHKMIGIDHFWIFPNESWNMTGLYNTSYITYVPWDVFWYNGHNIIT